jgi:hypothetical protein
MKRLINKIKSITKRIKINDKEVDTAIHQAALNVLAMRLTAKELRLSKDTEQHAITYDRLADEINSLVTIIKELK